MIDNVTLPGAGVGVGVGVAVGALVGVGVAVGRVVGVGVAVGAPLVMGVGDGVGVRVATDAVPPGPLHAASETVTAASKAPPATSNFIPMPSVETGVLRGSARKIPRSGLAANVRWNQRETRISGPHGSIPTAA